MFIVLIGIILLFGLALFFEIRELYYMAKYQRPESDDEECLYKKLKSDSNGIVSANCRNKYYSNKFKENGRKCPTRCLGHTYKECNDNFETMTKTDKYFVSKRILCMLSTILGMILAMLNIIDKIS